MNDDVTLRVNGREWGGWTSVRIGAGIERLARDYSVEITREWPGGDGVASLQLRVKNGDRVEVYQPLKVDPKVARRERFAKQGARSAGLFASRRAHSKAGY